MNVYHNIEKPFESWTKRKLTLFGKRTIVNTFFYIYLLFKLRATPISPYGHIKWASMQPDFPISVKLGGVVK